MNICKLFDRKISCQSLGPVGLILCPLFPISIKLFYLDDLVVESDADAGSIVCEEQFQDQAGLSLKADPFEATSNSV